MVRNKAPRKLNLRVNDDDSAVLTDEEVRLIITELLTEELNFFAHKHVTFRRSEWKKMVDLKIKSLENSLAELINDRVDKITEKIVRETKERVIEAEVQKRLELKLQSLKQSL